MWFVTLVEEELNIWMYVEKMTGYGGKYMMGSLFLSSVVIRIIK
jgi:hypothetical protein